MLQENVYRFRLGSFCHEDCGEFLFDEDFPRHFYDFRIFFMKKVFPALRCNKETKLFQHHAQ